MTGGAAFTWRQGQITWLLLYPFTQAWIALRQGRELAAGLWLAPVIVAKPIVALVALLLPWPVWTTAGIASALLTAVGIAWTGWETLQGWLQALDSVRWITYPANASLWGFVLRIQTGAQLAGGMNNIRELPWWVLGPVIMIGVSVAVMALRARTVDQRMALAFLTMLLMSPLGWIYYAPMAVGPLIASWPRNPGQS